jgi:hypothetical protein
VIIASLLSGTTQHNNAAVDLVFNGGAFPTTMAVEYIAQVRSMQGCLATLDYAIADVNAMMESGTLDGAMVKSVFFSLEFGNPALNLSSSGARAFVDCFVRYETRTRTVESGTDPDTGETLYTEEEYTVAVALSQYEAYSNLTAAGYPVTSALSDNARAVYIRIAYGNGGSYTGTIEYGGGAHDRAGHLAVYRHDHQERRRPCDLFRSRMGIRWGYVWGTYGNVLTESLLTYKIEQYP